ncbi:protein fantom isoform 1-T9 [Acridotheres tristis]
MNLQWKNVEKSPHKQKTCLQRKNVKNNHDALLAEGDGLNEQLKEGQLKWFHLQNKLQSVTISKRRTEDERISNSEKENELLKKNYNKLCKCSVRPQKMSRNLNGKILILLNLFEKEAEKYH